MGTHPLRRWCSDFEHPDVRKAPVHEAAEMGQLGVLRMFVHYHVCSLTARDGTRALPLSVALRNKQRSCAMFLLAKTMSKIPVGLPVSLGVRLMLLLVVAVVVVIIVVEFL